MKLNAIGAMLLCYFLFAGSAFATNHGQQIPPLPDGEEQPVCSVNVEEHLLLPTLALNEAAILRDADSELSVFWQWWHGLNAAKSLAIANPLKADDIRLLDATNPEHYGMHQRLRSVLKIAKAAEWPGLTDGFAERVEAKLVQPQPNTFRWGVMVGFIGLAGILWVRHRRTLAYQAV
jgi:hypothetical protein